jgi:hypothetical protein
MTQETYSFEDLMKKDFHASPSDPTQQQPPTSDL